MDGVNSPFEGESALSGGLPDYAKKAMPAERIAELALLDPKRAKRWGNLQAGYDCFLDPERGLLSFIYLLLV